MDELCRGEKFETELYRASNGCGRPMISADRTGILLLRNLHKRLSQNADVWSGTSDSGCRFNQVGGCARDVRGVVYMVRAFGKW